MILCNNRAIYSKRRLKLADNDEVVRRVEMCPLFVLYLKCKRTPAIARQDGTYDNFCRIAKRENVTHYPKPGRWRGGRFTV